MTASCTVRHHGMNGSMRTGRAARMHSRKRGGESGLNFSICADGRRSGRRPPQKISPTQQRSEPPAGLDRVQRRRCAPRSRPRPALRDGRRAARRGRLRAHPHRVVATARWRCRRRRHARPATGACACGAYSAAMASTTARIGEAVRADQRRAPGQHRQHDVGVVLAAAPGRTAASRAGRRLRASARRRPRRSARTGRRSRGRARGRSPARRSARTDAAASTGRSRRSRARRGRSRGCRRASASRWRTGWRMRPTTSGPARWRRRCWGTARRASRDRRRSRPSAPRCDSARCSSRCWAERARGIEGRRPRAM